MNGPSSTVRPKGFARRFIEQFSDDHDLRGIGVVGNSYENFHPRLDPICCRFACYVHISRHNIFEAKGSRRHFYPLGKKDDGAILIQNLALKEKGSSSAPVRSVGDT